MFELILEVSCPGKKALDGVAMFLEEALYPNGDAVTRLSLAKFIAFLVTLEEITLQRQSSSINDG